MVDTPSKSVLVVSAHAADFVWRAGGAIALHNQKGYDVTIICLSFGERGESAKLWNQDADITVKQVKASRRKEAELAAETLGAKNIEFFDLGDYPMRIDKEALFRLAGIYRKIRPAFVLSHSFKDPYNFDHPLATHAAQEARVIAQAHGHNPGEQVIGAPPVFLFEPHQPEQCEWKPNVLLDISEVWEIKLKAIETMQGQEHLMAYYTRVALQRGVQAKRNSGKNITHGEAYQRIFPQVTEELV